VAVSALAITGCNKKKDSSATKFTQTPVASKPATPEKVNDSDDIFNEFYKDDKGSQKEKLNTTETFTPTGASAGRSGTRSASGSSFSANGRYVVQVSTIRSKSLAERNLSKLEEAGYPAYIAEVQNPTPDLSGTYYRLRIGGFSTIAAAREFSESSLKPSGYDYWIDNKSNDNVGLDAGSFGNSGGSYQNTTYDAPAPAKPATTSASTSSSSDWGSSGSTTSKTPAPAASSTAQPSGSTTATPASTTPVQENKTDSGWGTSGW
jgi:cell division septation protein DedD